MFVCLPLANKLSKVLGHANGRSNAWRERSANFTVNLAAVGQQLKQALPREKCPYANIYLK